MRRGKQISPLLRMGKGIPPTLLLDGTHDWLNPQVREFVRQSKSLGAPVEAYYADGQPHGFFNRGPWLEKRQARSINFNAPSAT